jgi:uncharacterized membrane protein YeaQ/YmgE (transglycosylase-associated protein family)
VNPVIWLVVGASLGWIATRYLRTDARQSFGGNIFAAVAGALLGGWIVSPLVGGGSIEQRDFSAVSLVMSVLGAALVLGVANLMRRGSTRTDNKSEHLPADSSAG